MPRPLTFTWIIIGWTPKENTTRTYGSILSKFRDQFSDRDSDSISAEEVLSFLVGLNEACQQLTRHTRYSYLKAFFNFIRNHLDAQVQNPSKLR